MEKTVLQTDLKERKSRQKEGEAKSKAQGQWNEMKALAHSIYLLHTQRFL